MYPVPEVAYPEVTPLFLDLIELFKPPEIYEVSTPSPRVGGALIAGSKVTPAGLYLLPS